MAELAFDTTVNYQKIFLDDSVNLSVSNPASKSTVIIDHNLGYTPNVRVWYTTASGMLVPATSLGLDFFLNGATSIFQDRSCYYQIYNDSIKIVIDRGITVGPTFSTTVYYRIYLDGA